MSFTKDYITSQPKTNIYSTHLPAHTESLPRGMRMDITATPHRDGRAGHTFYEVWFSWEGGSLRTSSIIHDMGARTKVLAFLEALTGVNHTAAVGNTLDTFDWTKQDAAQNV